MSGEVSTRLSASDYLMHLRADSDALMWLWRKDSKALVPSCPGWDLTDLLVHTGSVYIEKSISLRTKAEPPSDGWPYLPAVGESPLTWFLAARDEVMELLSHEPPETPCWTWWPPEQTVGFWQRRMAQESLVHRWDAAHALGEPADLDPTLARDGVDELLSWVVDTSWAEPHPPLDGRSLAIVVDPIADDGSDHQHATVWRLALAPLAADIDGPCEVDAGHVSARVSDCDAVIAGSAQEVLLRLWGRTPEAGRAIGDDEVLAGFAQRLAALIN
jgi:uncharacterized protein (TIGR03083 family)